VQITFYGENDCTLGQFVDKLVVEGRTRLRDQKAVCSGKSCERLLLNHRRVYVHNETELSIGVEEAEYGKSWADVMVTWSECRLCDRVSPVLPVGEEMQRYSLGKLLEVRDWTHTLACCELTLALLAILLSSRRYAHTRVQLSPQHIPERL
jgi:1-phosphatidylinositol-3-phosphate 5-kinase